jgi:hypothetical protein
MSSFTYIRTEHTYLDAYQDVDSVDLDKGRDMETRTLMKTKMWETNLDKDQDVKVMNLGETKMWETDLDEDQDVKGKDLGKDQDVKVMNLGENQDVNNKHVERKDNLGDCTKMWNEERQYYSLRSFLRSVCAASSVAGPPVLRGLGFEWGPKRPFWPVLTLFSPDVSLFAPDFSCGWDEMVAPNLSSYWQGSGA